MSETLDKEYCFHTHDACAFCYMTKSVTQYICLKQEEYMEYCSLSKN